MLECTLNALCNFNPRQETTCHSPNLDVSFLTKWAIMGDVLKIRHKAIYYSPISDWYQFTPWSSEASHDLKRCTASPTSGDWIRVMAHLHCRRRTWYGLGFQSHSCSWQLGLESESDSVQCENFCIVQCCHWVWSPNPSPNQAVWLMWPCPLPRSCENKS